MTPCRQCGREIIAARVIDDVTRSFDAEPSAEGGWALWYAPAVLGAPAGLWRARHRTEGDRFDDVRLRRLHDCQPAGQQLELGA